MFLMASAEYALLNFIGHFTVTVIAGMIIFPEPSRRARLIFYTAVCSTFVDFDHFLKIEEGVNTFHNMFAFTVLPTSLVFLTFLSAAYEPGNEARRNRYYFSATLLAGLTGHMVFDIIDKTGLTLLYPFSKSEYFVNNALDIEIGGMLIPRHITLLLTFAVMILFLRYLGRGLEHFSTLPVTRKKEEDEKTHEDAGETGNLPREVSSSGNGSDREGYDSGADKYGIDYYTGKYGGNGD